MLVFRGVRVKESLINQQKYLKEGFAFAFWLMLNFHLKMIWMKSIFSCNLSFINPSQLALRRLTTLSQCRCCRCHNVVARSKMRVVPTSVSEVVTTLLSDVIKTLPQRCCNVTTTFSIIFQGHFTTDYSNFFPFIKTWET